MKKPQAMARRIFAILALSGLCNFAFCHRQYNFIQNPHTWTKAQQYCRKKHTDLATVNNVQDLEELARLTWSGQRLVYLGLHRGWSWSLSDADDYKEGEPAFWNWAYGQPSTNYCGSTSSSGEWFATDCYERLNFICYNASANNISQRFTLERGSMTWVDAQSYCRTVNTDLARVRNQLENEELQRFVNGTLVWIGLTRTSWTWSDGSQPSFIPWEPSRPLRGALDNCGALNVHSKFHGVIDTNCTEQAPFFCYSDPRRKHFLRLKLTTAHSSVDVRDPAVMESILTWVKKRLSAKGATGDVRLHWWKLPEKE